MLFLALYFVGFSVVVC